MGRNTQYEIYKKGPSGLVLPDGQEMDVCRRNLPALDVGMEHLDGDLDAVVLGERGPIDLRAATRPHGLAVKVGEDVGEAVVAKVP